MSKSNTTNQTVISAVIPEVKVTNIDWEYNRLHQSKPLPQTALDELQESLSKLFTVKVMKCRYGFQLSCEAGRIGDYWGKTDFPRICISERIQSKVTLPEFLKDRTAKRAEERGSSVIIECPTEFVVTPAEAVAVFTAIAEALTATKADEERKEAEKPKKATKKPAKKATEHK